MVYITGDIHGNPEFIIYRAQQLGLTKNDVLVLLGDVGANYYLALSSSSVAVPDAFICSSLAFASFSCSLYVWTDSPAFFWA